MGVLQITRALAEFAAKGAAPPSSVLNIMRLSCLDWAVCALAGRGEPVACIVRDQALADAGTPVASLFGSDQKVPARSAALVNGTISHALDYDDTHFGHIGHPSVAVIPAALAVAEREGSGFQGILDAALVGAEASVRVGLWLGRRHYQTGFHQTATAGAFGATLAIARLLGLTVDQTSHALGIATTRASGLKSQFGTMGKPYNAGMAAETGVLAAELAAKGLISNPKALDVAQGFGATHAGDATDDALDGLGNYYLFETISHKFHACCHGTHAALEALATLKPYWQKHSPTAVLIETHPRWMTVCNIARPKTGLEAKFSYAAVAAMQLSGRDTSVPAAFDEACLKDVEVVRLMDLVSVRENPDLSETEARVTLSFLATEPVEARFDLATPMNVDERSARLKSKAAALLDDADADTIWQAISSDDLGAFTEILRG